MVAGLGPEAGLSPSGVGGQEGGPSDALDKHLRVRATLGRSRGRGREASAQARCGEKSLDVVRHLLSF